MKLIIKQKAGRGDAASGMRAQNMDFDATRHARFIAWFEKNPGKYPPGVDSPGSSFRANKLLNEANISPDELCRLYCEKGAQEFVRFLAFENPKSIRADCIRLSEAEHIYNCCSKLYQEA